MIDKVKVDKYTIEIGQDKDEFVSRVLRNNEPWIDKIYMLQGGNLIMAMANEIMELRDKIEYLENEHADFILQINMERLHGDDGFREYYSIDN